MIYLPNLLKPGSIEWNAFLKLHRLHDTKSRRRRLDSKICTVHMILKPLNNNLTGMVRRFCNTLPRWTVNLLASTTLTRHSFELKLGKFVKISYACVLVLDMYTGGTWRFFYETAVTCICANWKKMMDAGELKSAVTNLGESVSTVSMTWVKSRRFSILSPTRRGAPISTPD